MILSTSRVLHWAALAGLLLLGSVVFANSLFNGFNVDDNSLILNNAAVHGLSPNHLRQIFLGVVNGLEYLPVRDLTYALDYLIWGPTPFGFHLSNLFYYLLTCLSLFFLLRRLADIWSLPPWVPFAITYLFMLHPVHVESVASIANRKDILSGGFVFLSCHAFVVSCISRRPSHYLYALILFILALFSKATVITVPFLLLLIDIVMTKEHRKSLFARNAPFFTASVIYFMLQSHIMKKADVIINAFESTFLQRIATAFEATVYYLKVLLIPYPLIYYRQFQIERDLTNLKVIASTALVALIVGGAILLRRKSPPVAFFLGWFLVTIVPVVGIIPAGTIVAERYLFLPSVAFCALMVICLARLRIKQQLHPLAITAIITTVALSYTMVTVNRNRDWRDSSTLFEANLRQGSREPFHYWIVGRANFNRGNYQEAFKYFSMAAALHPPFLTDMGVMKAFWSIKQNDLVAAAMSLDGIRDPEKHNILDVAYLYGMLAAIAGDRQGAMWWYGRALQAPRQLRVFGKQDVQRAIGLLQTPGMKQ